MPGSKSLLRIIPAVGCAALIVVFMACASGTPAAVPAPPPAGNGQVLEREVKAAFLLKFVNFVQWPEGTFTGQHPPLVIAVLDANDIAGYLTRLTEQQGNGAAVVRRVDVDDPMNVQVLYIGSASAVRPREVLQRLAAQPVLTVTSAPDRSDAGVINFVIVDGRVHFDIDLRAARRAGLRISAQLLRIARTVYDGEP